MILQYSPSLDNYVWYTAECEPAECAFTCVHFECQCVVVSHDRIKHFSQKPKVSKDWSRCVDTEAELNETGCNSCNLQMSTAMRSEGSIACTEASETRTIFHQPLRERLLNRNHKSNLSWILRSISLFENDVMAPSYDLFENLHIMIWHITIIIVLWHHQQSAYPRNPIHGTGLCWLWITQIISRGDADSCSSALRRRPKRAARNSVACSTREKLWWQGITLRDHHDVEILSYSTILDSQPFPKYPHDFRTWPQKHILQLSPVKALPEGNSQDWNTANFGVKMQKQLATLAPRALYDDSSCVVQSLLAKNNCLLLDHCWKVCIATSAGWNPNHQTMGSRKILYFGWSPPWNLKTYWTYILTFYMPFYMTSRQTDLACLLALTYIQTFYSGILSDI